MGLCCSLLLCDLYVPLLKIRGTQQLDPVRTLLCVVNIILCWRLWGAQLVPPTIAFETGITITETFLRQSHPMNGISVMTRQINTAFCLLMTDILLRIWQPDNACHRDLLFVSLQICQYCYRNTALICKLKFTILCLFNPFHAVFYCNKSSSVSMFLLLRTHKLLLLTVHRSRQSFLSLMLSNTTKSRAEGPFIHCF